MANTYSDHSERLRNYAKQLEKDIEAKRQSIGASEDYLMRYREDLRVLEQMRETMLETSESLRLLDAAGITLKQKPIGVTTIMAGERSATPRGRLG